MYQHAPLLKIINNVYICGTFLPFDSLRKHKFTHLINVDCQLFPTNNQSSHITATATAATVTAASNVTNTTTSSTRSSTVSLDTLTVDESDPSVQFETLDLYFGERYLMTVLPNIYKAVKFIEKALENSGKVLIGEQMGAQKATTIVIAFIMYKFRLKFVESFQIVRKLSTVSTVLDTYFIAQLCEYEPILEVQRRAMFGSSCSGELRTARLKRKRADQLINSPIKSTSDLSILCGGGAGALTTTSTITTTTILVDTGVVSRHDVFNQNEPIQNMET